MKHLTKYVANIKAMEAIFAKQGEVCEVWDAEKLTPDQLKELSERVECNLSPENLSCDGELRGAKLRAKATYLNGVAAELATYKATA
jgi:hypothetical protein